VFAGRLENASCASEPFVKSARGKSIASGRKQGRKASPIAPLRSRRGAGGFAPNGSSDANPASAPDGAHWTFLTNHTHVLVILSRNPSLVLREVALQVGITERAVQRIIADLESAGIIHREKVGRRNQYRIIFDSRLRHANESHRTIGELLALLNRP
jgi:hypothetical protein